MKKLFTISIILSFMSTNSAFALENELTLEDIKVIGYPIQSQEEIQKPVNIYPVEVKKVQEEVTPPKWEEYVPKKYVNPRTDFRLASAIIEMDAGTALTILFVTAPIGIPMICHSASKMKQMSYARRKAKFIAGLKEAEKIQNPEEKKFYYKNLLKECKLKEKNRQKYLKKQAKKQAKSEVKT